MIPELMALRVAAAPVPDPAALLAVGEAFGVLVEQQATADRAAADAVAQAVTNSPAANSAQRVAPHDLPDWPNPPPVAADLAQPLAALFMIAAIAQPAPAAALAQPDAKAAMAKDDDAPFRPDTFSTMGDAMVTDASLTSPPDLPTAPIGGAQSFGATGNSNQPPPQRADPVAVALPIPADPGAEHALQMPRPSEPRPQARVPDVLTASETVPKPPTPELPAPEPQAPQSQAPKPQAAASAEPSVAPLSAWNGTTPVSRIALGAVAPALPTPALPAPAPLPAPKATDPATSGLEARDGGASFARAPDVPPMQPLPIVQSAKPALFDGPAQAAGQARPKQADSPTGPAPASIGPAQSFAMPAAALALTPSPPALAPDQPLPESAQADHGSPRQTGAPPAPETAAPMRLQPASSAVLPDGVAAETPDAAPPAAPDPVAPFDPVAQPRPDTRTAEVRPPVSQMPLPPTVVPVLVETALSQPDAPITVTLTPEDLGALKFEMQSRGDTIHVTLTVERPETLDMLRRHIDQLTAEFRQAGFAGASFSFSGGAWGGGQERGAGGGYAPRADKEDEPPPRHRKHNGGGLDLRL